MDSVLKYLSLREYNKRGKKISHATNYEWHVVFECLIRHRNVSVNELRGKYRYAFGVSIFSRIPRLALLHSYKLEEYKLKSEEKFLLKSKYRRLLYHLWLHDLKMGNLSALSMTLERLGYVKRISSMSLSDRDALLQKLRRLPKNRHKYVEYYQKTSSSPLISHTDLPSVKRFGG